MSFISIVPDEPTTLEEDLLEDSNRVYHREVATFQLKQQERYMKVCQETKTWPDREWELQRFAPQHIDHAVKDRLSNARKRFHEETLRFIQLMKNQETSRNQSIQFFLKMRELGPLPELSGSTNQDVTDDL